MARRRDRDSNEEVFMVTDVKGSLSTKDNAAANRMAKRDTGRHLKRSPRPTLGRTKGSGLNRKQCWIGHCQTGKKVRRMYARVGAFSVRAYAIAASTSILAKLKQTLARARLQSARHKMKGPLIASFLVNLKMTTDSSPAWRSKKLRRTCIEPRFTH